MNHGVRSDFIELVWSVPSAIGATPRTAASLPAATQVAQNCRVGPFRLGAIIENGESSDMDLSTKLNLLKQVP